MIYEDAIKEITNVRTKRFRITTSDGEKMVMRLFVSASNVICEYKHKSKSYGYRIPYSDVTLWVSIKPIDNTTDFVKVKNFLTNVVKYLSASGLWENIKNDYALILAQGDDYLKHVLSLDWEEQKDYLTDTIGVTSFHVDSIISSARKGIVSINYDRWDRNEIREQVKQCIEKGERYTHRWEKGYDNSIEFGVHGGRKCGWYSTEYRGCANGHYYLALDERHAIFSETD